MKKKGLFIALVLAAGRAYPAETRNVILYIGDGFGPAHTALGIQYARHIEGRRLNLEELMARGETGYALPLPYEAAVIDSAASATHLATGVEVRNETLGFDRDGRSLETILEWAEKQGKVTGLLTNMTISHATPAAFASHQISRYGGEDEIATQMLGEHEIEVLLGGGMAGLIPKGKRAGELFPSLSGTLDGASIRKDERDLVAEARAKGYEIATDREALLEARKTAGKLLGIFSASHLPYVVDRRSENQAGVPTLAELSDAAISVLARSGKGFFLMIEGGRIDYAAHDNDAGTLLQEVLEFDEALGVGLGFQAQHPETLVVVTADHGTGGFSMSYSRPRETPAITLPSGAGYSTRYYYPGVPELKQIGRQTASFKRIVDEAGTDKKRLAAAVLRATGLELTPEEIELVVARTADGRAEPHDFRDFYADSRTTPYAMLGRALARHLEVVWATGGHTIEPVLTYGAGPCAEKLRGIYNNTHIYSVMKEALSTGAPAQ